MATRAEGDGMHYCGDVELMLQDYLDGYLLESQREVLERHVARCPSCRRLLAGITRIDDKLEELGEVDVPGGLAGAILDRLPLDAYAPSPRRRILRYAAAPLAALFLFAVGFLLRGRYVMESVDRAREVEVAIAAPQAVTVAVVGDFNGWDPKRNRLVRSGHEGVWKARLKLPPGTYQYSFVIDGSRWTRDPGAKTGIPDGFGGENSVMVVDG
ncbi:MAG: zf-HC2 domain-containing protein [Acidobacteria bacterium]|nr:zf-HC2 domain-containing protein [Acidobacteriota bacterium]